MVGDGLDGRLRALHVETAFAFDPSPDRGPGYFLGRGPRTAWVSNGDAALTACEEF